jgi:hypothetical protein
MDLSYLSTGYDSSEGSFFKSFNSELELVDEFETFLNRIGKKNTRIEREFNCGFGIADAVIFKYINEREHLKLSKLSPEWTYTLKVLPYRRNFDLRELQILSGASISSCKKAISNFISSGYCEKKSSNKFIKIFQPKPCISSSVAVEAKLRDWKKALYQASRYKTFSNQSWVLMDNKFSKSAIKNVAEFEKRNIGLATFSTIGSLECHYIPVNQKPACELSHWRANTLLAKRLISHIDVY